MLAQALQTATYPVIFLNTIGLSVEIQKNRELIEATFSKGCKPIVAVTMASSRQGRSVVRHLSRKGVFHIRAITRNPLGNIAQDLSRLPNVEVIKGDLLDKESLRLCFEGVYGVFGNTTPTKGWVIGRGSMVKDYELEQGRNLVEIVKGFIESGSLKHFVFSSICKPMDPLKNHPAPGHFSTKWSIEEYINVEGITEFTTVLRPASYFENFDIDLPGLQISERFFPGVVKRDKPWQTIAVDDIGLWTMAAFLNPSRLLGKSLNLANEEFSGHEMASLLNQLRSKNNQKVRYLMIPRPIIRLLEHDIGIMADWIERTGYGADIKQLRLLANELGITMTSLTRWLSSGNLNSNRKVLKALQPMSLQSFGSAVN